VENRVPEAPNEPWSRVELTLFNIAKTDYLCDQNANLRRLAAVIIRKACSIQDLRQPGYPLHRSYSVTVDGWIGGPLAAGGLERSEGAHTAKKSVNAASDTLFHRIFNDKMICKFRWPTQCRANEKTWRKVMNEPTIR
jgi:hypothetical protein